MKAKRIADPVYSITTKYELFEISVEKDENGIDVNIPRSIGIYTINQLQAIIDKADSDKANAQAKLDVINALQ